MTDTVTTAPIVSVLPEGVDMLDDLTVGELGTAGKMLGADPYAAIGGKGEAGALRWPALAHIAWVWAKRKDPRAKLQPFLDMTAGQVATALGMDDDDPDDDEAPQVDVVEELGANPTESPRV